MSEQPKPSYILLKIGDRSSFLIGRLLEENTDSVTMHFPVVMTLGVDHEEELTITASKWFPFAQDEVVEFPKEGIVAFAAPKQGIIEHYVKFLQENVELTDGSLEDQVLQRSHAPVAAGETEWVPSSTIH